MANGSKQPPFNIGGNGFIWLLVVAAGTFFVTNRLPLEGSRPPTVEKSIPELRGVQDIDARLWQDPFATVADRLTRFPELKPENCSNHPELKRKLEDHCQSPLKKSAAGQLLVASVSAAPYSEDQELRRRTRYAVLAGLNAEGFAPVDSQHIGFYWPKAERGGDPTHVDDVRLPEVVPFEWFERKRGERIPLLWFDEDVLRDAPLKQFENLLCSSLYSATSGSAAPWTKAAILGPQLSATLRAMVLEEGTNWSSGNCPKPAPQFFVYSATADDATLIPEDVAQGPSCRITGTCLDEYFLRKSGIRLYRLVATDEALAQAIRNELRLRQVEVEQKPYSNIALVSEWDTLYGQALPKSVARCLGGSGCQIPSADPFAGRSWLHRFKYLRGLDGQMPNMDGESSATSSKDTSSKQEKEGKESLKTRPNAKPQDRAEGQSQFDYLRRLGDRMQEIDWQLRRDNRKVLGRSGIEAVGILGSDLYDKLLVLQALRPLLPDALFFTTDLDALIMHPIALTSTRNLLVASSFDLQLRPEIQGEIPPFRSSYQTAGFLATRIALRSSNERPLPSQLKPRPLLFEIGSSGAFQFPAPGSDHTTFSQEDVRRERDSCQADLLQCQYVHREAAAMFQRPSMASAVLFSGVALCLLMGFPPLTRRLWARVDALMSGSTSHAILIARGTMILIGLGALIYALAMAIHALWPPIAALLTQSDSANGQPMLLLEGMSLWPTVFLRGATLVLCIGLIVYGYWWLTRNLDKIARDLHLVETREQVATEQDDIVRKNPPWIGFSSRFWYRLPHAESAHSTGDRKPDDISRFWRMYIYQGYWVARIYRVLAATLAMVLIWVSLWFVFGTPPVPARGSVSWWSYITVTALLGVATLILIAFVADTTLLTWRVVKAFRTETGIWPARTLQEFSDRLALSAPVLDDWIDLVFVSKRTKCITTLIYFPFVILALLVVSRSRLFADYGPNIPDLITVTLGVLIVLGCALALRMSAEASRAKARRRLADQLIIARKAQDGGPLAAQLEMLLKRVEELHDGAFSPLSQQPLVRAMLLPLGSLGGTALLEYLLLPGFS
jgi:hypothetical protein